MSELIEKEKVLKHVQWMTTQAQLYREIDKMLTFKQPTLNENQQIVLKSLKNKYVGYPIETIFMLQNELVKNSKINVVEAYKKLSGKEEMQVLQVFIQWVLEQEEHNERS